MSLQNYDALLVTPINQGPMCRTYVMELRKLRLPEHGTQAGAEIRNMFAHTPLRAAPSTQAAQYTGPTSFPNQSPFTDRAALQKTGQEERKDN